MLCLLISFICSSFVYLVYLLFVYPIYLLFVYLIYLLFVYLVYLIFILSICSLFIFYFCSLFILFICLSCLFAALFVYLVYLILPFLFLQGSAAHFPLILPFLSLQVIGSRCTPFSAACAREIIHGVTLPQLHERINLSLKQERREENSSPSSRSKAVFVSNMTYEWLF